MYCMRGTGGLYRSTSSPSGRVFFLGRLEERLDGNQGTRTLPASEAHVPDWNRKADLVRYARDPFPQSQAQLTTACSI
jgi:hypothetical protein